MNFKVAHGCVAIPMLTTVGLGIGFASTRIQATPTEWPDLTVLRDYPNPFGNDCVAEGKNKDGSVSYGEKATQNVLKNRFRLPAKFSPMTVDQFFSLPANQDSRWESKAISMELYVADVKVGGSKGESANCGATNRDFIDCHIDFTLSGRDAKKSAVIVGEVTERIRRLAQQGLLQFSKDGRKILDWRTKNLRRELLGRRVKVSGYLLFDRDHVREDWVTDPRDDQGNPNWRGSSWEIHPIMAFELLPN